MQESASTPELVALPWQRRCLSILTILILSMIFWCNLPEAGKNWLFAQSKDNLPASIDHRIRMSEWYFRYAAHLLGYDNKWQMYGAQSRFNWRFVITATYGSGADAKEVVLPLATQSERTAFQKWIVDHKEAKFYLNIYNDPLARETYARYLARQYPVHDGSVITAVNYQLGAQYILPPIVAVREQRLLEPSVQYDVINRFDVRSEIEQLARQEGAPGVGRTFHVSTQSFNVEP